MDIVRERKHVNSARWGKKVYKHLAIILEILVMRKFVHTIASLFRAN
jgi:hypothetical protein